uniref:Uncharacterized protein n=1 Tax=Oryctolagus cuniculus TaxID=9986 RepID=U3KNJ2_RABIT
MKRLLVATCLVSVLLCEAAVAPAPQVLVKTKSKQGVSEQDTEKAWGARALDPPEKGGQLLWPLPGPRPKLAAAAEKELPGNVGTLSPRREPGHGRGAHPVDVPPGGRSQRETEPRPALPAPRCQRLGRHPGHPAVSGCRSWVLSPTWFDQHHPHPKEALGKEGSQPCVLPPRQVLQGPEEDRDHIHHPA